jgi:putative addiction module killer protein
MYTFLRSNEFDTWLSNLSDHIAKARIAIRIRSAEQGNMGDCKTVGPGISEMRIDVGPGYRLYFTRKDKVVYLLLCGGDKSTQKRDIQQARRMLKMLEEERGL